MRMTGPNAVVWAAIRSFQLQDHVFHHMRLGGGGQPALQRASQPYHGSDVSLASRHADQPTPNYGHLILGNDSGHRRIKSG